MSRGEKQSIAFKNTSKSLLFMRLSHPGEYSHFPLTQQQLQPQLGFHGREAHGNWLQASEKLQFGILVDRKPSVKEACVMLFSVTLPASFAHLRMEVTSLPSVVLHWERTAAALTPTVPSLALTPQRYAVAVPALSGTWALVLYVCRITGHWHVVSIKILFIVSLMCL